MLPATSMSLHSENYISKPLILIFKCIRLCWYICI